MGQKDRVKVVQCEVQCHTTFSLSCIVGPSELEIALPAIQLPFLVLNLIWTSILLKWTPKKLVGAFRIKKKCHISTKPYYLLKELSCVSVQQKQHQHQSGCHLDTTSSAVFVVETSEETREEQFRDFICGSEDQHQSRSKLGASSEMCSLNRTLSLSVFPREPAAGLDATVDYVKVGPTLKVYTLHCYSYFHKDLKC